MNPRGRRIIRRRGSSSSPAPFARFTFGVPATAYQKTGSSFLIEVDAGDPWEVRVGPPGLEQLYSSGIGTGTVQFAGGAQLTRAMVANPANYLLTTARGASATASGLVWGPDLLGAKLLSWYDELSTFDAGGWQSHIGGAPRTMTIPAGGALPGVGVYFGRRTVVTDGVNACLARVFANAQTCETHLAGRWTGAPSAGNKCLVGGGGNTGGQVFRNVSDVQIGIFAGGILTGGTGALANRWLICGGRFSGAVSQVYEAGATLVTGNAGGNGSGGCSVGCAGAGIANPAAGETGEIIQITGTLSVAELAHQTNYLSSAWPP